jgi:hypothetical protein
MNVALHMHEASALQVSMLV